MQPTLPPSLYYLANFQKALAWLVERYHDLMLDAEQDFIRHFSLLETPAQALLVRMLMRKGPHFRASKLAYDEIGCPLEAAGPLLQAGWISGEAALALPELFPLLRKAEIVVQFSDIEHAARYRKTELLERLLPRFPETRCFADWCPGLEDRLFSLTIDGLCERLRLMFFGNLHQDWSEFVLADLGIFRYEAVALTADSRGFRSRRDIDDYLHIQRCREDFEAGEAIDPVLERLRSVVCDNPLLAERRAKLLFRIARQLEREDALDHALEVYQASGHSGARLRRVRVLERAARHREAYALARQAASAPESDTEAQGLERVLARLGRRLGLPRPDKPTTVPVARLELRRPRGEPGSVEHWVKTRLSDEQGPVHYVENSLICSLFGLLCWEAIFAPLPGAFFHPFHTGPADLLSADFHRRRAGLFAACLAHLDSTAYKTVIRRTYADKFGIQSPFVAWAALDETLLEQALDCLPAAHLLAWFKRLLADIRANRAGMPDLIQFWPAQKRYRMVEVKGPGDRLQDNQRRWLAFCHAHGMPVDVCYVQWAEA